jgi:hypothetical protein
MTVRHGPAWRVSPAKPYLGDQIWNLLELTVANMHSRRGTKFLQTMSTDQPPAPGPSITNLEPSGSISSPVKLRSSLQNLITPRSSTMRENSTSERSRIASPGELAGRFYELSVESFIKTFFPNSKKFKDQISQNKNFFQLDFQLTITINFFLGMKHSQ